MSNNILAEKWDLSMKKCLSNKIQDPTAKSTKGRRITRKICRGGVEEASHMVYIPVLFMTKVDQFSSLDGKVCMRAKKCLGSPVLKYSYQDSSVFD